MKKLVLSLAVLAVTVGPSLSWGADEPSAGQPTAPGMTGQAPSNTADSPSMGASQAIQSAPANWTNLKGTVQSVDPAAKIVQIKEDSSGNVLQIPVDKQVSIQKDGKSIKLSQVQAGDSIVLAKRSTSSQEQEKTKAY